MLEPVTYCQSVPGNAVHLFAGQDILILIWREVEELVVTLSCVSWQATAQVVVLTVHENLKTSAHAGAKIIGSSAVIALSRL